MAPNSKILKYYKYSNPENTDSDCFHNILIGNVLTGIHLRSSSFTLRGLRRLLCSSTTIKIGS